MEITLSPYDPQWPGLFEREAARIREALGSKALVVEHTGSTAVPQLIAKPVIDLLLVVEQSDHEDAYLPLLEQAGYRLKFREPDWHEHRLFKGPDTDINLHVLSDGCEEVRRILAFRDWLRRDAGDRDRYARAKQALALRTWPSVDEYAAAKSEIVEEILSRALEYTR